MYDLFDCHLREIDDDGGLAGQQIKSAGTVVEHSVGMFGCMGRV